MKLLPVACLCLLTLSADANVMVKEDSDVILPCSLSTKENIQFKLFDWKKAAQKDERQKEVFFYDAGVHYNNGRDGQSEQFKGRVSHFIDELKQGNASITIRNTKVTDSGSYTCDFPRLQPRQTFRIELTVYPILKVRNIPGASSKPHVTIIGPTDDGLLLQCEVRGAYPEPTLQWRDSAGNNLTAAEPRVKVSTDKDPPSYEASLKIRLTTSGYFRCVATQHVIHHQTESDNIYVPPIVQPVYKVVTEGSEVILPCSIGMNANIELELFFWRKDDRKEVFKYNTGIHSNNGDDGQSEQFKGRVSHFPEELKHGSASITIRDTEVTDSGDYTCDFPRLWPQRQIFHVKLFVAAGSSQSEASFEEIACLVFIFGFLIFICVAVFIQQAKLKRLKGLLGEQQGGVNSGGSPGGQEGDVTIPLNNQNPGGVVAHPPEALAL